MIFYTWLVILTCLTSPSFAGWKAGVGRSEITYYRRGAALIGYGFGPPRADGIHTRLYARSFLFEAGERRVFYTVGDLWVPSARLKSAVIQRVNDQLGSVVLTDENFVLAATHTHSTQGGFTGHRIFDLVAGGFDTTYFDTLVKGIAESLLQAWRSRQTAQLFIGSASDSSLAVNRSLIPHLAGALEPAPQTNPRMTLLKILAEDGSPLGSLNWFAVHANSLGEKNTLLSGDNKGVAALLTEQAFGDDFVAGFANSDEGDAMPSERWNHPDSGLPEVVHAGRAQATLARKAWADAMTPLEERIAAAERKVYLPALGGCHAAYGHSFAAGSEESMPFLWFKEGITLQSMSPWAIQLNELAHRIIRLATGIPVARPEDERCHGDKPILYYLPGDYWLAETLPFQILTLGGLAILAAPAELTTNAGTEVRAVANEALFTQGVSQSVISGLSNDYSSYVTTEIEYGFQHYEGGSTLFGPKTSQVYASIFADLATRLAGPVAEPAIHTPLPRSVPVSRLLGTSVLRRSCEDGVLHYDLRAAKNWPSAEQIHFQVGTLSDASPLSSIRYLDERRAELTLLEQDCASSAESPRLYQALSQDP